MNWYKKSNLKKKASMSVYVSDYEYPTPMETINDISNWISTQLYYKTDLFKQMTDFEKAYWQKNRAPEFVTLDGLEMDQPTGTINVYLAGLPEKLIPTVEKYVSQILTKAGIKFNPPRTEDSRMFKSKVMRFDITENPNAGVQKDTPPELNMANMNAKLVFEDILGYDLSQGSIEITIFDLMNKMNKIKNNTLEKNKRDWSREWGPGKPEMQTGGYSKEQINRTMNTVKEICDWALQHGYKRIYLA